MLVQPYDWSYFSKENVFEIRIWTLGKDGKRILLRVVDWKPFLKLELPDDVYNWTESSSRTYCEKLKSILKDHAQVKQEFKKQKKLYWYNPNKSSMVCTLRFNDLEALKHCMNLSKKGIYFNTLKIKAVPLETEISQIHKFITELNLGYCSWIEFDGHENKNSGISTCEEYIVSYKDIKTVDVSDTTKPLVAAYDLECYSARDAFPNPYNADDTIFQISYITRTLNDDSEDTKYLLTWMDCHDIEGVSIIRCSSEQEMIFQFGQLIIDTNPTILTGYNIYSFDNKYIKQRLDMMGLDVPAFSCLVKDDSTIYKKRFESKNYGLTYNYVLQGSGRLNIDILSILKRDYKLDRYSLEFVSQYFLGKGKHDVSAMDMFKAYRALQNREEGSVEEMTRVAKYCVQDSALCIDIMEKLSTWISLTEMSTIVQVTIMDLVLRGQQVRVANQVYSFIQGMGIVMDKRDTKEDAKGGKVFDPKRGRYENVMIFDFASLYPSIIRAYNICNSTLVPSESDISDEQCNVFEWEDEAGKHRHRFVKKDIREGILPKMCEFLVTERKKIRKKISPLNSSMVNSVYNQRQNAYKICVNSIYGVLNSKGSMILLPEAAACITARGRQVLLQSAEYVSDKGIGRLVYGDTDSVMIYTGIKDPYECIETGEKLEKELSALFPDPLEMEFETVLSVVLFITKKRYAGIQMVRYDATDIKKIDVFGIPGHTAWECIDTKTQKKRYFLLPDGIQPRGFAAGLQCGPDGCPDTSVAMNKGIVLKRRDNCLLLRGVYSYVLKHILFNGDLLSLTYYLDDKINSIMHQKYPLSDFVITKGYNTEYKKTSTYNLKTFIDKLKESGKEIVIGDRIDYVIVKNSGKKQGDKMRLLDDVDNPLDYSFYISNQLAKPIEQLISLAYPESVWAERACKLRRIIWLNDNETSSKKRSYWIKRTTAVNRVKLFTGAKFITRKAKYIELKDSMLEELKDSIPRSE